MSRFHSYINSAKKIVESYNGEKPFAIFLKQFFSSQKKYGSKDRKHIAALCYNYFRLGFAAAELGMEEKMLLGMFLCEEQPSEILGQFKPEWNQLIASSLEEKLAEVKDQFQLADLFPFGGELNRNIIFEDFSRSFLVQPDLFIRIRPQAKSTVLKKLEKSRLPWHLVNEDCVRLPASTNIEEYFLVDKEVVIQDYSSQQSLNFLRTAALEDNFSFTKDKPTIDAWDCCAASGGKSILLKDIFDKKLDLTISDIRASIVLNLHQRFKRAGIKEYKYFISDISQADFTPVSSDYDLIICDAPCTGSGTWSRTPEQLCYFKESSITYYSDLQRRIVTMVLPHLQGGGIFVYITCSVFSRENEMMAAYIEEQMCCERLFEEVIKGYDKKADSMYVAVFRKR
jgi:16S rRNA (cytosine967-C5)-methyltransferase